MTETESMVERVAKAIFDAENGLDGDCVGDMIYEDFRIDGPVDNAMKETMIVCTMAARAAIAPVIDHAVAIMEARLPLYTDIAARNAIRECISSIKASASVKALEE